MKPLLSRRRRWGLLALALGLVGAYLAFNLAREHERVAAAELERLTTESKVIEDNLTRQLTAVNRGLEYLRAELPGWKDRPDGRAAGAQHLKSLEAAMRSVRAFLVLDAKGTAILSSRAELMGLNFSQRHYFQASLRSLDAQALHVSVPFMSSFNAFGLTLSRTVLDANGEFGGVVVASVDPVDIQILLNSVRYADDMRSMLVHGDGTIFISQPTLVDVIGKNVSVPGSFFRQHLESKRPVSHFEGIAPSTGDNRLPVLRTVQPAELAMDKPLVVSLSRESRAVYAHWQRDVRNQSVAYLLLVLLSALGLTIYQRWQVRQGRFEERLKLATQASGVGIWEYDLASKRYDWDAAMFALFGLNPEKANALNNDWLQTLLPGESQRMKDATRATIKQGQVFDMTFQIRRADGQLRFMHNRAALHCDEQGTPRYLIGATDDVTERKQREADLRIAAAAFDCQESIVVTDPDKVILRVNRAFSDLSGYTAEEALGQTPRLFKSGRHEQPFYAAMWECIKRDGAWQGEVWNRKKSGEIFPDLLSITAVHNEQHEVTHYVGTHVDLTDRKAAQATIEKLAFYDALTGLPNRRLLNDRLHQALSKAKRNKTHLALLFIDLDKFKPVNDDFGHQAGDELLLAVAQRLQTCVRESDAVARVGGDEFVVLLSAIEAAPDASAVARKIHDALIEPFVLSQGQSVTISSSTGIAIYPEHGSSDAELTQHADAAMYQAKAAGRDRFEVYTPAADSPIENP